MRNKNLNFRLVYDLTADNSSMPWRQRMSPFKCRTAASRFAGQRLVWAVGGRRRRDQHQRCCVRRRFRSSPSYRMLRGQLMSASALYLAKTTKLPVPPSIAFRTRAFEVLSSTVIHPFLMGSACRTTRPCARGRLSDKVFQFHNYGDKVIQ
mgnify:FL=1